MTSPTPGPDSERTSPSPSEPTTATPGPSLEQEPERRSPLFQRPTPRRADPGPLLEEPGLGSVLHDGPPSPSTDPGADSASGRLSTGSFKPRELREAARAAVRTVGRIANRFLTRRGTPERQVELFVPDQDDQKAIGDPLASLASRRLPEGAKNPDAMDLLRLALGFLEYLSKQAERKLEAEEIRADYEWQPQTPGTDPADPQEDVA